MLQTFYYEPFKLLAPELKARRAQIQAESSWTPRADIVESKDEYQLLLDLPGIDPQSIDLTQEKQLLTIVAEKTAREIQEGELVTRSERKTGTYKRQFTLPEDADIDSIRASSKNGVLTLHIGRKVAVETVRKIDIQH